MRAELRVAEDDVAVTCVEVVLTDSEVVATGVADDVPGIPVVVTIAEVPIGNVVRSGVDVAGCNNVVCCPEVVSIDGEVVAMAAKVELLCDDVAVSKVVLRVGIWDVPCAVLVSSVVETVWSVDEVVPTGCVLAVSGD